MMTRKDFCHRIQILSFHVYSILEDMQEGAETRFSYWGLDTIIVKCEDSLFSINGNNVGNKHGAYHELSRMYAESLADELGLHDGINIGDNVKVIDAGHLSTWQGKTCTVVGINRTPGTCHPYVLEDGISRALFMEESLEVII